MKKCGVIILAGGMGSRLGFQGPKGCFEISPGKTLFEVLLEKGSGEVAIMTSPRNHEATLHFLKEKGFAQVALFQQSTHEGVPDGNGGALHHFIASGVAKTWKEKGIEYIQVIPVDNPLANPWDPDVIKLLEEGYELVLKAFPRTNPDEKVGVIETNEGKLTIKEYTEISDQIKNDLKKYPAAYSGCFGIHISFLDKIMDFPLNHMPYHFVKKNVDGKECIKRERFIFDLFFLAKHFFVLIKERESFFAPIKSKEDIQELTSK